MNLNNTQINTDPKYNLILDTVRKFEPLGRCDIAKITRLNGATVTKLVRDLIQAGFLKEDGLYLNRYTSFFLIFSIFNLLFHISQYLQSF